MQVSVLSHFIMWNLGLSKATTQTTVLERECLCRYAKNQNNLIEIGVWHGVTTCCLRRSMSEDGTIFAIDPFPKGRLGFSIQMAIAHTELNKVKRGTVTWWRMTGVDAAIIHGARLNRKIDFIFIDGDHSYDGLKGDWEGWSDSVRNGGVIALHDSRSTHERNIETAGSVCFTNNIVRKDVRFALVDEVDSLTVWKRNHLERTP